MAMFETVPIGELKHRLPAKLLPLVEEYKDKLENLPGDQGGRLVLEKGDDAKDEEGSLSFYLEGQRGRRRKAGAEAGAGEAPKRKRGRPRKAAG